MPVLFFHLCERRRKKRRGSGGGGGGGGRHVFIYIARYRPTHRKETKSILQTLPLGKAAEVWEGKGENNFHILLHKFLYCLHLLKIKMCSCIIFITKILKISVTSSF